MIGSAPRFLDAILNQMRTSCTCSRFPGLLRRLVASLTQGTALFGSVAILSASCSSSTTPRNAEFQSVWRNYESLPSHRALAVAGEISKNRYVFGMVGGSPSADEAVEAALRECLEQRAANRMQDSCKIYAVDLLKRHELQDQARSSP